MMMIPIWMCTGTTIISKYKNQLCDKGKCLFIDDNNPSILEQGNYFNGLSLYSSKLYKMLQANI